MTLAAGRPIAGIDGCKAGWVVVFKRADAELPAVFVASRFDDVLAALPADTIIAVDMPIGLPERTSHGGRGSEFLVRRHLGQRQSSVFSIPSRAALYAETAGFTSIEAWYAAHRRASAVARETSDPPRAVSIQAFGIFGKIREIDAILRADLAIQDRLIESHPELAFWRLNGERAMALPKKIKGRVNPAGMEERKSLLERRGLPRGFLGTPPPRGSGEDDLLDACAMLFIAARQARGEARPLPDPPAVDGFGIRIAIWS